MRRSESQSLYSALPGAYINYSSSLSDGFLNKQFDRKVIRISHWNTRKIDESDIYYPKIVSQIKPDLRDFLNSENSNIDLDGPLKNFFNENQQRKVCFCEANTDVENQIYGHLNPKMFYCPKCGKIKNLKKDTDIKEMTCDCTGQKKGMNQYNRVWVCSCGEAYPLEVDETKYRYFAYLQDGFLNQYNKKEYLPSKVCPKCGSICKLINSTDPKCFYPRTITSVKLTENNEAELCVSKQGRDLILDRQLNKISNAEFKEKSKNIITNNEIPTQSGSALDAFLSNFQSAVEVPKEKYNVSEEVVYKILEYNTIKEKIEYFNQLEYAIKQAVDSDEIISEKEMYDLLKKLKIKDISSVGDIEIINTAYGYTRRFQSVDEVTNEKDKFKLCAFPTYNEIGVPSFYNVRTLTEGILIDIDKEELYKYIKDKYSQSKQFYFKDISGNELDLWFMDTKNIDISLIKKFEEIDSSLGTQASLYTKDIYSLLHTISHMMINTISEFCGIDKSSLSEMIFVNTASVFIYSQSNQGAVLGALTDMFRKDLYKVLKNVYDDNKLCIFDPLCMTTSNGSCCACSFLDEVACEHFNKDLSRKYLFGYGKIGDKDYVKNFWDGDE